MPSNSRIAEQGHGVLRAYLDSKKLTSSLASTDYRSAYMFNMEYDNRVERREMVEKRLGKKVNKKKSSTKHEATKKEQQKVGLQLKAAMAKYNDSYLESILSAEEKEKVKIQSVNKRGVSYLDEDRNQRKLEDCEDRASKRRKPDKTTNSSRTNLSPSVIPGRTAELPRRI